TGWAVAGETPRTNARPRTARVPAKPQLRADIMVMCLGSALLEPLAIVPRGKLLAKHGTLQVCHARHEKSVLHWLLPLGKVMTFYEQATIVRKAPSSLEM